MSEQTSDDGANQQMNVWGEESNWSGRHAYALW